MERDRRQRDNRRDEADRASRGPQRILLVRPCCIGDVVLATAALAALRRAYPEAHITWAVGRWSRPVVENHPALNALLDTGEAALPVKSPFGFVRFLADLQAGDYDLLVSLVRSPLMSGVVLLSGIPLRAGPDSGGRGFGYNVRAPVDPQARRHEAEVYLDVVRALGVDTEGCYPHVPVTEEARAEVRALLDARGVQPPYIVANPAGGSNPGMEMAHKRYPPPRFAELVGGVSDLLDGAPVVLIGGPGDSAIVNNTRVHLRRQPTTFVGALSFPQIAALAADAALYLGNDTGLTHYAAAAGAPTAMIFGPSDPQRYAPYTPRSIALWRPVSLAAGGVAQAEREPAWDWERDGITVAQALAQIRAFLGR